MSNSAPYDEHEYVLGTHDDELRRLGFQHQVWSTATTQLWERARFAPGHRLLDLGSGPGYATTDLAQLVGSAGEIAAVDVSPRFLSSLRALVAARGLHNVHVHQADATALAFPPDHFDGVFARWVLCFTPDPAAVLAAVARVLAPGGRLAVLDYANYEAFSMAPGSEAIDRVFRATTESVRRHGGDFEIARRLPTLMRDAGLEVESIEPVVRVGRPGSALWNWPASFFANYLPTLIELGLLSPEERTAFEEVWRARSADPSAYLITPTMVGIVGVKR